MKKLLIDDINMLLSKTSESSQSRKYKMLTDLKRDIRNNKPYTLPKYLEKEVAKKTFDKDKNMLNQIAYELITKASGNYQDRYSPEFQDLNPENLDYIMEVLYND